MVQRAIDLEVTVERVAARSKGHRAAQHGSATAAVAAGCLTEGRRHEQVAGAVEGATGLREARGVEPAVGHQRAAAAQRQVASQRRHAGERQRAGADRKCVPGCCRQTGDGVAAAVQHYAAAVVECDEHEVVQAGQGVAGPVCGVGPEGCACAAVPADAAADDAAEADAEGIAVNGGRIAGDRCFDRCKRAADAVAGGDQGERQRAADVGGIFGDHKRAAERDRTADGELVVGVCSAAADPQFENAGVGLHEVAGHAQRAVLEGTEGAGIGQRAARADVDRAVAEDVGTTVDREAAEAAQYATGAEVGIAVVGQCATDFQRRARADLDEIVVGEGAAARGAGIADVETQPAAVDVDPPIVGEIGVIRRAARNAQRADCELTRAGCFRYDAAVVIDHRDGAGTGRAVAETEVRSQIDQAVVVDAPGSDDVDVAFQPVQCAEVGQRAGAEALVAGRLHVVAAGADQGQRCAVGDDEIAGQRAARPAATAGDAERRGTGQRAAIPVVGAGAGRRIQRQRATGLEQRARLQSGLCDDLAAARQFEIGDRARRAQREAGRVLHAHGEGVVGDQGRGGRIGHLGRIDEFDASAAVELACRVEQIGRAAAVAAGGAEGHIDHTGIAGAAGRGE